MNPLVSIIIVNWNAGKYLEKCIKSLMKQSYKEFEIILVDNASTDGSLEEVENKFPNVRIIKNNENLGFGVGVNNGISECRGDVIALFNPDAVAEKDWLQNLVSVLYSSDKIGAASGKLLSIIENEEEIFCTWSKMNPYTSIPYYFKNEKPSAKVDTLTGAAMVVKKEVIKKIGLLDPEYFLYYEETDWCARIIRAGYDLVYVPNSKVWHSVSSLASPEKKIYYNEKNRVRFAIKNFDRSFLFIFLLFFIVESLVIFAKGIVHRNFLRTKRRIKIIQWNLNNLSKTLNWRKNDFAKIKESGKLYPYNKSLPLKNMSEEIQKNL